MLVIEVVVRPSRLTISAHDGTLLITSWPSSRQTRPEASGRDVQPATSNPPSLPRVLPDNVRVYIHTYLVCYVLRPTDPISGKCRPSERDPSPLSWSDGTNVAEGSGSQMIGPKRILTHITYESACTGHGTDPDQRRNWECASWWPACISFPRDTQPKKKKKKKKKTGGEQKHARIWSAKNRGYAAPSKSIKITTP
jgi:hypothetical protein